MQARNPRPDLRYPDLKLVSCSVSEGTRICTWVYLDWAEMYHILARFWSLSHEAVGSVRDTFVPTVRREGRL